MLKFDAATKALLDISYAGSDITRRRLENMAALAPAPGERILDLGCGQGLLTQELARAVGPGGEVIGVDPSPDMLSGARARCRDMPWVRILEGRAGEIPVEESTLDAALSLQVFEYLADVPAALDDLYRALRSGGRLVIGDMQFDTMSFASDEPDRMAQVCRCYEDHVEDPNLPAKLPSLLRAAGFRLHELRPVPFASATLRPDGLAFMTLQLMRAFALQKGIFSPDEAETWLSEQQRLSDEGRFFFSLTHFIAIATRP